MQIRSGEINFSSSWRKLVAFAYEAGTVRVDNPEGSLSAVPGVLSFPSGLPAAVGTVPADLSQLRDARNLASVNTGAGVHDPVCRKPARMLFPECPKQANNASTR